MRGGYSGNTVAALAILSFFAGSFIRGLVGGLPEADRGITVHEEPTPASRNKLLEVEQVQQQIGVEGRQFGTFEELLEASGMLKNKPPRVAGESGNVHYTVQPVQQLSWYPRAYILPNFLDAEKCQHIIKLASQQLRPSNLAFKQGDTPENTRNIRTSDGAFLARRSDPDGVLAYVEDKIASVAGIPAGHGEPFNVLRYQIGQHYDSHSDAFADEEYKGTAHFSQSNQRIATMLLYLSDVEEGGETVFLLEGKAGLERLRTIDYKACDTGIKVKPRMGDALLFWSVHHNGTIDRHALHGACPVVRGEKWVATKWMRSQCMQPQLC